MKTFAEDGVYRYHLINYQLITMCGRHQIFFQLILGQH